MRGIFFLAIMVAAFILGAQAERMFGLSVFWAPESETVLEESTADPASQSAATDTEGNVKAQPSTQRVAIPSERLTESQKSMLRSFGVDPESITVTAETIACAETALGTERFAAVQAGATPSFTEGIKLLGCYKK